MELDKRKRIKKNYCLMVDNIEFSEIQDRLFECDVVDDEELELIEGKPTKKSRIRELIKILKGKRGDHIFDDFCRVLEECEANYGYIAKALRETEVADEDEDLLDGGEQSYKDKVEELMKQLWNQTQTMVEMKKEHRIELEELKRKLSTVSVTRKTPYSATAKRPAAFQMDTLDGSQFVQKYVAEFIQRPSDDGSFSWNRFMSRFRPRSLSEIENVACRMGIDLLRSSAGRGGPTPPSDVFTDTMRRKVGHVLERHGSTLRQCVAEMDKVELDGYLAVDRLADELFEDDKKVNWGRIVAWYAFWAQCVSSLPVTADKFDECVEFYGRFVGFYVARRLHVWIARQGGWGAFVQYYCNDTDASLEDSQSSLFDLLATAARVLIESYPYRP